jgi:hypothetical protein
MAVTIRGLAAVKKQLKKELEALNYRASNATKDAALVILKSAQSKCPRVTGNLINSGFIVWRTPRTVNKFYEGRMKNPINKTGVASEMSSIRKEEVENARVRMGMSYSYGAEIHFAAPYAIAVHENPNAGQTTGMSPKGRPYPEGTYATSGEWKFLETAVKENADLVFQMIASGTRLR